MELLFIFLRRSSRTKNKLNSEINKGRKATAGYSDANWINIWVHGEPDCAMKTFLAILSLTISLTTVGQSTNEQTLLILPCGKYANWTNFNVTYPTFKKNNNRLIVDTTSNLTSNHFVLNGFESLEGYLAISKFLGQGVVEYRQLNADIDKAGCESLTPVYIKYINGNSVVVIRLKTLTECQIKDELTLMEVNEQLKNTEEEIRTLERAGCEANI